VKSATDVLAFSGPFSLWWTITTRTSLSTWFMSTLALKCRQEQSRKSSSEWTELRLRLESAEWTMAFVRYTLPLPPQANAASAFQFSDVIISSQSAANSSFMLHDTDGFILLNTV